MSASATLKALISLVLLAALTACAAEDDATETPLDGLTENTVNLDRTPLLPGQWIEREAEPPDTPGWFPEMGEVRVRIAEPGESPVAARMNLSVGSDGKPSERTELLNEDGSIWEPPASAQPKASAIDCMTGSSSNSFRCPCYPTSNGFPVGTDKWGNNIVMPGRCMFPDNEFISYSYVRPVGNSIVLSNQDQANVTALVNWTLNKMDTDGGSSLPLWYSLFEKTDHPVNSWGPYPSGWYQWSTNEDLNRFPGEFGSPHWYPRVTDIVIRKQSPITLGVGVSSTDSNCMSLDPFWGAFCIDSPLGITISYFERGTSPHTIPAGNDTVWKANPIVRSWKPCVGCPWIEYLTIVGSQVVLNQAEAYALAGNTYEGGLYRDIMSHLICHEVGHAVGLGHMSGGSGNNCLSEFFPVESPHLNSWYWSYDGYATLQNAKTNVSDAFCSCGQFGCDHMCAFARRAPIGAIEL